MPLREHPVDACPGALQVHQAADGGLARIRVPGGRLTGTAFRAVATAAADLGDGTVELTSRANLQIRGLAPDASHSLGPRLAAAGLLPSATHERVRNILANPVAGEVARSLVLSLDHSLCARPALAALPGRFLFAIDLPWPDADIAALLGPDTATILLASQDVGLRVPTPAVVSTMLSCAEAFLTLRTSEWRITELNSGPTRIAHLASIASGLVEPRPTQPPIGQLLQPDGLVATDSATPSPRPTPPPLDPHPDGPPTTASASPRPTQPPIGQLLQPDGLVAIGAAVPLGRLTPAQAALLAESATLVITPWRGILIPDLGPTAAPQTAARLAAAGLLLDPHAPGVGISACTGRPGCAHALADVRTDAAAMIAAGTTAPLPVHWSACPRRCGRPRGSAIDIIATEHGYTVTQESR